MEMTIHPLQKASVELLISLYQDLGLPTTGAMLSVINGYYPATNEILKTLHHYKDQPKVIEFVKNHEAVMLSAKESLEQKTAPGTTIPSAASASETFLGSDFDFKFVKAYQALKIAPIESIEKALSEALSKVCKEDLLVEIDSMQKSEESINFNAEIKLCVKPARLIR